MRCGGMLSHSWLAGDAAGNTEHNGLQKLYKLIIHPAVGPTEHGAEGSELCGY